MNKPAAAVSTAEDIHHWWNNERFRGVLYQVLLMLAVAGIAWFLIANTLANLAARHIATGFSFLSREAGFGISEHLIDYAPTDDYLRALTVGLLNTFWFRSSASWRPPCWGSSWAWRACRPIG
jgi:ABC-type amino acid transport system permease subunit